MEIQIKGVSRIETIELEPCPAPTKKDIEGEGQYGIGPEHYKTKEKDIHGSPIITIREYYDDSIRWVKKGGLWYEKQ